MVWWRTMYFYGKIKYLSGFIMLSVQQYQLFKWCYFKGRVVWKFWRKFAIFWRCATTSIPTAHAHLAMTGTDSDLATAVMTSLRLALFGRSSLVRPWTATAATPVASISRISFIVSSSFNDYDRNISIWELYTSCTIQLRLATVSGICKYSQWI